MVARTRFELVISALRGRRPKPLDERAVMAGMEGVEPPLTEPESAVLPLDDIPVAVLAASTACKQIYYGTAPPSARGEFRRILYHAPYKSFEPFWCPAIAFVVKNESVVTRILRKSRCDFPIAGITGSFIWAVGRAHPRFPRRSVTTLSFLAKRHQVRSRPALAVANWLVISVCAPCATCHLRQRNASSHQLPILFIWGYRDLFSK